MCLRKKSSWCLADESDSEDCERRENLVSGCKCHIFFILFNIDRVAYNGTNRDQSLRYARILYRKFMEKRKIANQVNGNQFSMSVLIFKLCPNLPGMTV